MLFKLGFLGTLGTLAEEFYFIKCHIIHVKVVLLSAQYYFILFQISFAYHGP